VNKEGVQGRYEEVNRTETGSSVSPLCFSMCSVSGCGICTQREGTGLIFEVLPVQGCSSFFSVWVYWRPFEVRATSG